VLPGQRRALPSPGAVKMPSSATWLGRPWSLAVGSWAVQRAGYRSGTSARRPASPPGFRSVLGVPGALRPTRLQRSKEQSSTYATAYRQLSREASVRKGFGSLWVATTSRHFPHCVRSLASSSDIQGGDRPRRAMQMPRARVDECERPHGEPGVRAVRFPHHRKAPEPSRPGATASRKEEKTYPRGLDNSGNIEGIFIFCA
jgi:hypothetical protein